VEIDGAVGPAGDQLADLVAVAAPFFEQRENQEFRATSFEFVSQASARDTVVSHIWLQTVLLARCASQLPCSQLPTANSQLSEMPELDPDLTILSP
jgi:hypothetical protein